MVKTAGSCALYYSGAIDLRANLPRRQAVVLGLHRVVEDFEASSRDTMPSMLISTDTLERYLDWIGRRHRFASLDEILETGSRAGRERLVALTFDDGYQDIYHHAFPLLQRKRIPFAVFVVTGLVGTDRLQIHDELFLLLRKSAKSWGAQSGARLLELLEQLNLGQKFGSLPSDVMERTRALLHACPQRELIRVIEALRGAVGPIATPPDLRALTWPMIEEMHAAGVTIGSHTATHALLTNETPDRVAAELLGSKRAIESRIGAKVSHFAYPDGKFNSAVVVSTAHAGYQAGYTICRHRDPVSPRLTIPRLMLWEKAGANVNGHPSPAVLSWLMDATAGATGACRERHAA
jgi:peptidoglycan/xylan/chitin deacetylase (PgdA/CDA1 family)